MKSFIFITALLLSPLALGEEVSTATDAANLKVTSEQKKQIHELMQGGVEREEARKQVLSEEQLQARPEHMAKHKQMQKQKRKRAGSKLLDQLELTEEQKQEIEAIRAAGGGRKEIHAVLTQQQMKELETLKRERKRKGKRKGKDGEGKDAEPVEEASDNEQEAGSEEDTD